MKGCLVSSFFLLVTVVSFAQHRADVRFFDKDWNPILDRAAAAYYRKIQDADSVYRVTDYYADDRLYMEGFFSSVSPAPVHHGKATWYFRNGGIYRTGYFKKGKPVGIHKEYYENGLLKNEILFDPQTEFHLSAYDENGNPLLNDGYGSYVTRLMNREYVHEIFDSQLLRSYFIDEKGDTIYGKATRQAQFERGGMEQFYKNLRKVNYPVAHRKAGTDGTVYVSFVIDRDGRMTDLQVVKSPDVDFSRSALDVVKRNKGWKPAQYEGRPVPMQFVVPVVFLHQYPEWNQGGYGYFGPGPYYGY